METIQKTRPGLFPRSWFSALYWQLSLTFLVLLILLAGTYGYVTVTSARQYFEAAQQRLNGQVAGRIVEYTSPFVEEGVDGARIERIFFNAMVINPSIEVYLLDTAGRITNFYGPAGVIKRHRVALEPLERYIASGRTLFIRGDDPRNETGEKIFSAARVERQGRRVGYVYVVLAGERYDSALAMLRNDHIAQLVGRTLLITLGVAFVVGLLAFWFITRHLNAMTITVRRFREGDLAARIQLGASGELLELSQTFNAMADTLAAQLAELKMLEQLRRELVANISHDLRTPVTAIHGYAETLWLKKNGLADAERDHYTHIILQSADRLKRLVEELFALSKLDAPESTPRREPINLRELVQEVYQAFQLQANRKNISLSCTNGEGVTIVEIDAGMVERVLQNLVDNAIKYTPAGGSVAIRITDYGSTVEVSVADTGPGIAPEVLPYVFDR
ncbi:MAG: HAMP domain-containing histidine kinase, partial [Cytophagales bacterium]|nr:HAMP domain-containing histidine kinase [Cytophagales bacterium]